MPTSAQTCITPYPPSALVKSTVVGSAVVVVAGTTSTVVGSAVVVVMAGTGVAGAGRPEQV